jgi:ABC-type transport system involved in multi-copper enzyme maturation permease subunit
MKWPFGMSSPILVWELRRVGRSRSLYWIRIGLALFMFVALAIAYNSASSRSSYGQEGNISVSSLQRFAENYMVAFLIVEIIAVVVLTPILVAGGLAREKELRRLDFLRTTPLTEAEMNFGMYFSRVLHVLCFAALGVPIIVLSMLFGSVDIIAVMGGMLIVCMTAFSLGAYVQWQSLRRATLRDTLLVTYWNLTWTTGLGFLCGCLPFLSAFSPFSTLFYFILVRLTSAEEYVYLHLVGFVIIHSFTTFLWLSRANHALVDPVMEPNRPSRNEVRVDVFQMQTYDDHDISRTGELIRNTHPPIRDDENAFDWKEKHFSGRVTFQLHGALFGCVTAIILAVIFSLLSFLLISILDTFERGRVGMAPFQGVVRVLAVLSTGVMLLMAVIKGSASIVRERERDTLAALLVLPVDRSEILWAKFKSILRSLRFLYFGIVFILLIAVSLRAFTIWDSLIVGLRIASICFITTTGAMFLSRRMKTTTSAMIWCVVLVFLWQIVPLMVGLHQFGPLSAIADNLIPFHEERITISGPNPLQRAALVGVECALAWLLWFKLKNDFEKEGRE